MTIWSENSEPLSDDLVDYHLISTVKQCLSVNQFCSKDMELWNYTKQVLNSRYLTSMDEFECEIRFHYLINKYMEVLRTSKTLFETWLTFKCFDLFNDISFEALSDLRDQLISELKTRSEASINQSIGLDLK